MATPEEKIEKPHADRDDFFTRVCARWPDAAMVRDLDLQLRSIQTLESLLHALAFRAFMSESIADPASVSVRYEISCISAYGAASWWACAPDVYTRYYRDTVTP